jgi:autotransporter-associated beta strand protein
MALLTTQANPARVYAQTQSGTWTLVGSSTWGNTAAWSGGLVAGGTNNTASVTVAGTAALTSNVILGNLTTSSGRVQIVGADASPSAYQLQFATTTGTAPTITNAGRLDMRPTITGTLGFRKAGTGDMYLWQTNTYTGTTTLTAGRTRLQNGGGLGSTAEGTVVLPAATLMLDVNGLVTTAEPLFISGTGFNNQGSLRLQTGNGEYAGPITATGSASITANVGLTLTLSGLIDPNSYQLNLGDGGDYVVSGGFIGTSGTVSFTGPGAITLSGSSSFTGTTSVVNSTGLVTMTGYMAGPMAFNGSSRTLIGTGTFAGGLSVGQGNVLSPGASGTAAADSYGTITASTLAVQSATVRMGIQDATTYDRIVMTSGSNGLTLGGTTASLNLDFASPLTNFTTLDLFNFTGLSGSFLGGVTSTGSYSGTWAESGGVFTLANVGPGNAQTLTFNQATGDVVVIPEPSTTVLLGSIVAVASLIQYRRHRAL